MSHRLAGHTNGQLSVQAGQVFAIPNCSELPHGLIDCFVRRTCPDLDLMDEAVGIDKGGGHSGFGSCSQAEGRSHRGSFCNLLLKQLVALLWVFAKRALE